MRRGVVPSASDRGNPSPSRSPTLLTATEIADLTAALAPRVIGGQLQKIRQPDAETLVLRIRRPGETIRLVLSTTPARIAEAPGAVTTLPEPTTLGAWIRSAGGGRRVTDLRAIEGDRIVELELADGRLVAELTGRHANLIAVDADDRVVALAHRDGSRRGLVPGGPYTRPAPPPPRDDPPPRWVDPLAVEAAAAAQRADDTEQQDAAARRRLLTRARKKVDRLHRKVEADLERAEQAERYKRDGELLKGALHTARKGDTEVWVTDYYAEGTPQVRVELDPALDPVENLERLFARYRKAIAGAERARERLDAVEAQWLWLEELAEDTALPVDDLEAELIGAGLVPAPQAPPGRKRQAQRMPYNAFESARGERILVGRGGADNHETTFRHASGNDHWLHVRDVPGAHVIVPLPARGREPHQETLLDAAALAVHHSDLRGEPGVEVMHTRRKHVRAIKGAGAGRVTVAGSKSLVVDDGPARITRLYRSR